MAVPPPPPQIANRVSGSRLSCHEPGVHQETIYRDDKERQLFVSCLGGSVRENRLAGPRLCAHRQSRSPAHRDAERWVGSALTELGLDEEGLRRIPKGAEEKMAMAWWLRGHTTLSRQWIAQRLQMGHETRVTLAVREVGVGSRGRRMPSSNGASKECGHPTFLKLSDRPLYGALNRLVHARQACKLPSAPAPNIPNDRFRGVFSVGMKPDSVQRSKAPGIQCCSLFRSCLNAR